MTASLLIALLFLAPALLGCCIALRAQLAREKITLVLIGATGGIVAFTTLILLLSTLWSLTPVLLWVTVGYTLLATIELGRRSHAWSQWRRLRLDEANFLVLICVTALGSVLSSKLLLDNGNELATGILNAWGDLGWHFSVITRLAELQTLPLEDPILAGTPLVYPFLSDFFSSILLVAGASYATSVVLPACVFIGVFFGLFFALARQLLGDRTSALIALILLFFGGSTLGWTQIAADFRAADASLWQFITHLPRDYSGNGVNLEGYHFLNIITSSLLPQRSFLFGMPLAISILLLLLPRDGTHATPRFIAAGCLSGLLPLAHAHTVLALLPAIGLLALTELIRKHRDFRRVLRRWITFSLVALAVGLPEVAYYLGSETSSTMMPRWEPGWTSGDRSFAWFWFQNVGLLLPLSILALFTRAPYLTKLLALGGLVLFAFGNLFLLAPWGWDNFKILIFWLILSLPAISYLIGLAFASKHRLVKVGVVVGLAIHTLSGGLDLWKTSLPNAATWGEWNPSAVELAETIRRTTPLSATIVTAPYHNTPVALSGRALYLGFSGHVWSHGKAHWAREQALRAFYEGSSEPLPEIRPDYVVVGPVERAKFNVVIQPSWELVSEVAEYSLYRLP